MDEARELMLLVARDRDRGAFTRLFALLAPRLKSYFLRLVVDPVRADELVQEVMLVVWRRAASYDPRRAAVSTWVFTIARNLRIDVARRERRADIELDDPALVTDLDRPDEQVDASRRAEAVRTALAALPTEQADVVRCAYFDGMTLADIATERAVPLGTVKSRVRLALQRLRAALEA